MVILNTVKNLVVRLRSFVSLKVTSASRNHKVTIYYNNNKMNCQEDVKFKLDVCWYVFRRAKTNREWFLLRFNANAAQPGATAPCRINA